MSEMGIPYECMSPDIDEKAIRDTDPEKLVIMISHAKADALEKQISELAYIITADQVVTHDGRILEKPVDIKEAKDNMRRFGNGEPVCTVSGLVVVNTATKERAEGIDIVSIHFKPFPDAVIEELTGREYALHVAGGFQLEDPLTQKYVVQIDGTIDSVMGLPKKLLLQLLDQVGFTK